MPKVDLNLIEAVNRTGYPPPFDEPVKGRWQQRIGPVAGLTALAANRVTLDPGAWSSQRHWHDTEDELVVMLSGEAVLIEDEGETLLRAGDIAAWSMGGSNGHHLINRSAVPCTFIAFSAGERSSGGYSDIDMLFNADGTYSRKDGTPY